MIKLQKNKICLLAIVVLMLIGASIFLCGCENGESCKISCGENGAVTSFTKDGDKYYRAVADRWYTFDGWYQEDLLFSENEVIKINSKTPPSLEARFTCTGVNSFDRILNSLYNTYSLGSEKEGHYFELSTNFSLGEKDLTLNGFISFQENISQISLICDEFDFIYNSDAQNSVVLLSNKQKKVGYKNMPQLLNIISSIPAANDEWSLKNIFDEKTFHQINQLFGINNSSGFVENVENGQNNAKLTLSLNKILNMMKNMYPKLEEGSLSKILSDIFVSNYLQQELPKISMEIQVEYIAQEREEISNAVITFKLSKDYVIKVLDKNITLKKSSYSINIKDFNLGYTNSPSKIDKETIDSYPIQDSNMLNARFTGNMSFLTNEKVLDEYSVEINADINPFALLEFKKDGNFESIDWNNFGFFSINVSLIPDELNPSMQASRHNNSTEYLNVLIDTKHFGGQLFVFSQLYNPSMVQLTKCYFINSAFDINELLYLKTKNISIKSDYAMGLKILSAIGNCCLNFDGQNLNGFVFDIINNLLGNNVVTENLILTESGVRLNLSDVRLKWRAYEEENNIKVLNSPLKLDKYAFGEDEIVAIELKMNEFSYNCVTKNANGNYLGGEGNQIKLSPTFKTIAKIENIEAVDLSDLQSLINTTVKASLVTFTDFSQGDSYINNKNSEEEIILEIIDAREIATNQIRLSFAIYDSLSNLTLSDRTFGEIFSECFKLPYGLYIFDIKG